MLPSELFSAIKLSFDVKSDSALAGILGITPARISQLRTRNANLSSRQVASYIKKAKLQGRLEALQRPILPVIEMYPITVTASKRDAKWNFLPTAKNDVRNLAIRKYLESAQGIYVFYDSMRCAIYAGKTEKLGLWTEMTNAFNRERANHQSFYVAHPTTGKEFTPSFDSPRQPYKRQVYLHDTAHYFSAYQVTKELIPNIEALLIRAFCNGLSNKKMEKFIL